MSLCVTTHESHVCLNSVARIFATSLVPNMCVSALDLEFGDLKIKDKILHHCTCSMFSLSHILEDVWMRVM